MKKKILSVLLGPYAKIAGFSNQKKRNIIIIFSLIYLLKILYICVIIKNNIFTQRSG